MLFQTGASEWAPRAGLAGVSPALARPVPQVADAEFPPAAVFHRVTNGITATNTTDNYQVSYHPLGLSHMDSFCHFFADGTMYNGYAVADNITPETGCKKDSVMAWKEGIVTRAVLYDPPQLKGVDWIQPETPITRADLEAWEKKSGWPGFKCCVLRPEQSWEFLVFPKRAYGQNKAEQK
jgi:hypothetical protein